MYAIRKNSNGIAVLIFVFAVTLTGAVIYRNLFTDKANNEDSAAGGIIGDERLLLSTPTPFPFQEMTIPYLRERNFTSSLSNPEKISENQNYTSYLTSYDSDGLKIYGLLTKPPGDIPSGGWPAIIFVHGYIPPAQYKTTVNYINYIDYFAKNGFVVFKIDLRGNGNSDGEPGGAYYSGDYVIDTLNAYSALQSTSFVNPNKIGLWGHSMAGNIVFRSFVAKPDIRVAVIWAGAGYSYEDLKAFGISDNSYRPPPSDSEQTKKRRELIKLYGDFDKNSSFWMQVVPTNYIDDKEGAIQFHHAQDDKVVSIDYSRNIVTLLDKTDIMHELKVYPEGGHNITGDAFTRAMQSSVEFFKSNLN